MGIICKEDRRKIIKENIPLLHSVAVNFKNSQHIEMQKKISVCKITTNSMLGTGFFGLISFPEKKFFRALFTCYHNLETKDKSKIEQSFQYSIGINEKFNEIKIDDSRFIYKNPIFDIIIIEILDSDDLHIDSFLEMDDIIYKDDNHYNDLINKINDDNKNNAIQVYILHYPKGELLCDSTGIISNLSENYDIEHKCSTEKGSSGGPIINLNNQKVFGIHNGHDNYSNINYGKCIRGAIKEFIQQYQKSKKTNYLTLEDYNKLKSELIKQKGNSKSKLNKDNIPKKEYELKNDDYSNENFNSDIITIKYNIDYEKKTLKLFDKEFVERNKDIKIIIKGKVLNILEEIDIDKFTKNEKNIQIYLKDLNKIKSICKIFKGCDTLISLPNIFRWDTSSISDMSWAFSGCKMLSEISDISKWNTENVIDMGGMFEGCISLISLPDISKWNTSNVVNFSNMFSECNKLTSLPDISKWDFTKAINISKMFNECKSLQYLPDISIWDISNVEDMSHLFLKCENLLSLPDNLSQWNTINVVQMKYLFGGCYRLKQVPDISGWNTSNVKDIQSIFINCRNLTELPDISKWNTSNIKYMNAIFAGCRNITYLPDISKWDTSTVIDMKYMFFENESVVTLQDISKWNTSNVKYMNSMFERCFSLYSLPDISRWNISNVFDLRNMFGHCTSLQELPDISKWKTKNVRLMTGMFHFCYSIKLFPNIGEWDTSSLQDYKAMFFGCNPYSKPSSKFLTVVYKYRHRVDDIFDLKDD